MRPVALPSVLVETQHLDGWRNPQWVARNLEAGDVVVVEQSLIHLDVRLQRAPEGVTLALVTRLLNNWKNDRTDEEKDWQFDDWADDLEQFSEAHLKIACATWRREQSFPPKIADIRALCMIERGRDHEMHRRCRVLLGLEAPRTWEAPPPAHYPITLNPDQRALLATVAAGPEERRIRKA